MCRRQFRSSTKTCQSVWVRWVITYRRSLEQMSIQNQNDPPAWANGLFFLMEMRRIELLSENDAARLSPSAVIDQFQRRKVQWQPLRSPALWKFPRLYSALKCGIPLLASTLTWREESVRRRGVKPPVRNRYPQLLFEFPLVEPVRGARHSLIKLHPSPSKPLHPLYIQVNAI